MNKRQKKHYYTENRAKLRGLSWQSFTYGKIRVFQHDENEDEFYVSAHPIKKYSLHKKGVFKWMEDQDQIFDNLPSDKVTLKSRDYIAPLLFEINERKKNGILPRAFSEAMLDIKGIQIESVLYGPMTRDEIINQMRLRFAYL